MLFRSGSYSEYSYRSSQIDANVLLNADYRIKEKWTINAVAGWNINQRAAEVMSGYLTGLAKENWPSYSRQATLHTAPKCGTA